MQEDNIPKVSHFTQRKIYRETKEWGDWGCTGTSALQQMAAVLPVDTWGVPLRSSIWLIVSCFLRTNDVI